MKILEIYLEKNIQLDEVNLKKALKHAAVAGVLGAGILGTSNKPTVNMSTVDNMSTVSQPTDSTTIVPDKPDNTTILKPDFIPPPEISDEPITIKSKNPPGVHPAFPNKLINQPNIAGNERISNFINHFLPLVDAANEEILQNRHRLITLIRHYTERTDMDEKWLTYQLEKYQVDTLRELLQRMDIVPRSMSLAQAAVESGWGTSELARKGNAFYGQKSWTTSGSIAGSPGEKYSAFSNPGESVAAYIHNLNTHPAYEGFRKQREEYRNKQKTLSGYSLIGQLGKYSTKGPDYISYVRKLMSIPQFKELDNLH